MYGLLVSSWITREPTRTVTPPEPTRTVTPSYDTQLIIIKVDVQTWFTHVSVDQNLISLNSPVPTSTLLACHKINLS